MYGYEGDKFLPMAAPFPHIVRDSSEHFRTEFAIII
jgi:hypothetical protein